MMNYEKMSDMYRSLKMRIEPNSGQRRIIEESLRCHCYVYNGLITACKLYHKKNGNFLLTSLFARYVPSSGTILRICMKSSIRMP